MFTPSEQFTNIQAETSSAFVYFFAESHVRNLDAVSRTGTTEKTLITSLSTNNTKYLKSQAHVLHNETEIHNL